KHDAIERKNLLIANGNLIAECLSKEVFSVATNYELNEARFTEMNVAHTIVEARCLELEAELANLRDTSHHDNQEELINRFSKLELQVTHSDTDCTLKVRTTDSQITQLTEQVTNLQAQNDLFRAKNDKVKQHYKELYDSIKITHAKHIEQVTALTTKKANLKAQILEKVNSVSKDKVKPKVLVRGKHVIDVEPIAPRLRNNRDAHLDYLRHLKESVETIRDIVEEAKVIRLLYRSIVSACRYTKHSQELLEYAIGTYPQDSRQRDKQLAHIPLIRKKQVTFTKPSDKLNRVNSCPNASGSQPRSNTKKNRIPPAKGVNKLPDMCVVTYLQSDVAPPSIRHNCNVVRKVKQIWKPKQVRQVWKPTGKALTTIGHQWRPTGRIFTLGNQCPLTRVYYVEGLGNNLFSVRQFCDSELKVAFRKHSCYVRDTDGVELTKGSCGSNLYTILIEDMMKSSPICLLSKGSKNKSWLWHRRLNHLNFGTINDLARKDLVRGLPRLKFKKDHLCSVCQLGKSKKHTHKPKTENTNLKVLNTLYMDLCGPMRVQTINEKKYILVIVDDYSRFTWVKVLRSKDETPEVVIKFIQQIQVGLNKTVRYVCTDNEVVATACYIQNRSLIHTRHNKTPYELVHNKKPDLTFFRVFEALCYPTNDSKDLGKLEPTADIGIFIGYAPSMKPMFDEYLEPPRVERPVPPAQAVQAPVYSAGIPSSTSIDQDAPSLSISPSSSALQSHSLHQGVTAESSFMKDNLVAPVDNTPFVNVFALEPHSEASSFGDISSIESTYVS
nr:retrovirus-related Pol polyprotein from transposon TNT 1-94 [Tanacetum cinerariifolium]